MTNLSSIKELVIKEQSQLVVLTGLSVAIIFHTVIAMMIDRHVFERFLGRINPVLASIVVVALAMVCLSVMLYKGWFVVIGDGSYRRFMWPAALALVLAVFMALVDSKIVLGKDINAFFPQSLPYYPVVGYAAELLFHLLPLTILLLLVTTLSKSFAFEGIIWPIIIIVALIEPIFQALPMTGKFPAWSIAYVALNVLVINLVGLYLFKRYDLITMYAFRLMYYLPWHIIWGYLRLKLLF
jgi:hypothetical protein